MIYTYDGWTGVIYFSEEVRDPARDVPRALFSGVWLVMAIYLLMNVALLRVLPLGRLAGHPMPVGLAAEVIFGPRGDTVVRARVIISMLAAINAFHLMATRVLFAMSRDRLVCPPRFLRPLQTLSVWHARGIRRRLDSSLGGGGARAELAGVPADSGAGGGSVKTKTGLPGCDQAARNLPTNQIAVGGSVRPTTESRGRESSA